LKFKKKYKWQDRGFYFEVLKRRKELAISAGRILPLYKTPFLDFLAKGATSEFLSEYKWSEEDLSTIANLGRTSPN